MNYKEIINRTIVPSILSVNEQNEIYKELIKYVNSQLPSKLYRFRSCTERNLESFYDDSFWFSNGGEMNDDFDARIYYNKKKIEDWIKSQINAEGNLIVVEELIKMDSIPNEFKKKIPNAEYIFYFLKNVPKDYIRQVTQQMIKMLSNSLDGELKRNTDIVQNATKFACLTEKIYSDMMWGNYAENATGFALEYEFGKENALILNDIHDHHIVRGNLFPILYDDQRIDATEYAKYLFQIDIINKVASERGIQIDQNWLNIIVPCPDVFMVTKLALKKSSDWRKEKEWRMFFNTNDMMIAKERHSSVKIKPSAVYLGRKISGINQKIIADIAKEKEIPVYKMAINENARTYRLKTIKVQ